MDASTSIAAPLRQTRPDPARARAPAAIPLPSPPQAVSRLLACILEEIDYGLMLVSGSGRLHFANHRALRECTQERAMQICGGLVLPRSPHDQDRYAKALAASCGGRRSLLALRCGTASVSVALVPLEPAGEGDTAVLLLLGKPHICEPLSMDFFAMAHHLTGAEAEVLKGLCSGLRPTDIATRAGVALSTIRTQITGVRLKTGAASIRDLIHMVTVLPPMLPAFNRGN